MKKKSYFTYEKMCMEKNSEPHKTNGEKKTDDFVRSEC